MGGGLPVELGPLHQSVRVAVTNEGLAVQTGEAFWVVLLFSCDLDKTQHTECTTEYMEYIQSDCFYYHENRYHYFNNLVRNPLITEIYKKWLALED